MDIFRDAPDLEIPPLVFFNTKKQQSRLTVGDDGCFIELENKADSSVKRYRVHGKDVNVRASDKPYKDRIGLVDIGDRRNWLYSKKLFLDDSDLQEQVKLRLMP